MHINLIENVTWCCVQCNGFLKIFSMKMKPWLFGPPVIKSEFSCVAFDAFHFLL